MSAVCVLLIDDEPDTDELFRQHFRRSIRAGEMLIVFARSADEALAHLASGEPPVPTLVLSDIKMPGRSGLDLLREIRPAYPDLPVYMVSAFGGSGVEAEVRAAGADGFFTKPIDLDRLGEVIAARLPSAANAS